MASLVISRQDLYPAGTKVKAFKRGAPPVGELQKRNSGNPENWKPALTKEAEATVSSEGKLEYTIGSGAGEVPEGVPLLLWAEVGGGDVFLAARANLAANEKETV